MGIVPEWESNRMNKKLIIAGAAALAIAGLIFYIKDKKGAKSFFSDVKGAARDAFMMNKDELMPAAEPHA
jgi:hypothetical protein